MEADPDAASLVGRVADERLLTDDASLLPASVGRPEALPPATGPRTRIVGAGATLTAVSLIAGIGLTAVGVVAAISGGIDLLSILAVLVGLVLAGTHWGWVHVAEVTADAMERRGQAPVIDRRRQWLASIEPYTRHEVTTDVASDGSITIDRVEYRPVATGERGFVFDRHAERLAVYSGDDAAATVAEQAELLRQAAAADTERERLRYVRAAGDRERALLGAADHEEELAVRRAAAAALSEKINSRLRDPPLT